MRKWSVRILAAAGAAFVLSGCAAALIGGAAAGGYYAGKDSRTAGRIADDVAITSAVKSKLIASSEVKASNVNIDTYEGVVSLRGEVKTPGQRVAAEQLARSVKGVRGVKNELRVMRLKG